jgi:ketosteroid isomerase-like protein
MAELPDNVADIEQLHSEWMKCELTQDIAGLLALCSDDIELWPPEADIVSGREAVSAYLCGGRSRIENIEISQLRVRAADGLAVLTSHFRTTFRVAAEPVLKTIIGTHLWVLRRQNGRWLVELLTWRNSASS